MGMATVPMVRSSPYITRNKWRIPTTENRIPDDKDIDTFMFSFYEVLTYNANLMDMPKAILVQIAALVEDQATSSPIVVLHDKESNKLLPIWIGDPEARAIAIALNKVKAERPLTHRLLINVIDGMGGKLMHIIVDRMKIHTYFASLYISVGDKVIKIDARPSDSIALALEAGVPIYVQRDVMDAAGQPNPFPEITMKREAKGISDFKHSDLEKLKSLLERAREREQKSSNE